MKLTFIGEGVVKIEGKEKDSSLTPQDLERMGHLGLKFRYVEVALDNRLIATFVRSDDSKRRFD